MSAFAQFTGAPGGGGVFWPVLWLGGGFGWLPMAGVMARHGRELPGDEAGAGAGPTLAYLGEGGRRGVGVGRCLLGSPPSPA